MNAERFKEIWQAVMVNAFYSVGAFDCAGGSDISHEEMKELMEMAKDSMNGDSKKHLRIWWPENGRRLSGIVIENTYINKNGLHLHVKLDGSNETRFVEKKHIDASEWVDDPKKGYGG